MKLSFKSRKRREQEAFALAYTRGHSMTRDIWRRLLRDKSSVISMGFLCLVIFLAIFANLLFDEAAVTLQETSRLHLSTGSEQTYTEEIYLSAWYSAPEFP